MGKYDHINTKPSESTAKAAKRGLELRKKQPKSGKAGLDAKQAKAQGIGSGVQRASNMANRKVLSPATLKVLEGALRMTQCSCIFSKEPTE